MQINILNRDKNTQEEYRGKIFIDATYEGDLAAAAGVPFRVGREGKMNLENPEQVVFTNIGMVRKWMLPHLLEIMLSKPTTTGCA